MSESSTVTNSLQEAGLVPDGGSTAVVPTAAPDDVCAAAVELARAAAVEVAGQAMVGDHAGIEADGERIVTHYFGSLDKAYVGWRWAVTVVRAPRSKNVTVDEVVLLPGAGALLAPSWVPWNERLQAGDLGVGDVISTAADDERLVAGYEDVGPHDDIDDIDSIDALVNDMWLGRPRVLSLAGRDDAAQRWYGGDHGPDASIARAAKLSCGTCGFLVLMRGALSRVFGVCANEYAPDDGRVVSFDHGCGAHSEVLVIHTEPVPQTVVTETEHGVEAEHGDGDEHGDGAEPEVIGETASSDADVR